MLRQKSKNCIKISLNDNSARKAEPTFKRKSFHSFFKQANPISEFSTRTSIPNTVFKSQNIKLTAADGSCCHTSQMINSDDHALNRLFIHSPKPLSRRKIKSSLGRITILKSYRFDKDSPESTRPRQAQQNNNQLIIKAKFSAARGFEEHS